MRASIHNISSYLGVPSSFFASHLRRCDLVKDANLILLPLSKLGEVNLVWILFVNEPFGPAKLDSVLMVMVAQCRFWCESCIVGRTAKRNNVVGLGFHFLNEDVSV